MSATLEWSFYDVETGQFTGASFSSSQQFLEANTPPGCAALLGVYDYLSERLDLVTGEVIDWQPPKPDDDGFTDHAWDDATKRWLPFPTLAGVKRAATLRVNTIREARFDSRGVTSAGIAFRITKDDANLLKVFKIREAAGAPPEYETKWRDEDNIDHMLNLTGLNGLAAEMGMHGDAIFNRSWALKDAIVACENAEAVAAIDVEEGWP